MRLLHTADLHLGRGEGRALDALDELLETAAREEVDAVTLGGDSFDSVADAERLRPTLREWFTDNPFEVLAVPGNHDAEAFEGNVEFGPDLSVLSTDPLETRAVADGEVVGVPYRERLGEDLFFALQERASEDAVLLVHCTLDAGFAASAAGDEERATYFPIQKETLGDLGYDFVLAGHIHTGIYQTKLSNGGLFIYPGSPVAHSWTETGRRHAVVVDTSDGNVRPISLNTYYRDCLTETVTPGEGYEVIERVERWVDGHDHDRSDLEVRVRGVTEIDEMTFDERLRAIAGPATVTNETRGVGAVLEHPIYEDFRDRLDDLDVERFDHVQNRGQVNQRVVEALARLLETGEVTYA